LIGVGYMFLPGLVGEVNFEANKNQFYPEDFRFGFFFTYSAGYTTRDGIHRDSVGNQWRPWPWSPAHFGPASGGPMPATWSATPALPSGGWAAATFASAAAAKDAAAATGGAAGEDKSGSPAAAPQGATP